MRMANDRGRAGTTNLGEFAATLQLGHLHLDYNLVTLIERLCEQKEASTSSTLGGTDAWPNQWNFLLTSWAVT